MVDRPPAPTQRVPRDQTTAAASSVPGPSRATPASTGAPGTTMTTSPGRMATPESPERVNKIRAAVMAARAEAVAAMAAGPAGQAPAAMAAGLAGQVPAAM